MLRVRVWLTALVVGLLASALVGCTEEAGSEPGRAAATAGQGTASSAPPPTCAAGVGSALAPRTGALLGVSIDWGKDSIAAYSQRLGRAPSVVVTFTELPLSAQDRTNVEAGAAQAAAQGAMLLLTLEPHQGLAAVTPEALADLVSLLRTVNATGVPVVVRFAHEMNGSWYPWGQQPREYVASFRQVAAAVHDGAPGSSMMWAPSYGGGYPFTGGEYQASPGSAAARVLDTNDDGVLAEEDDSYSPYYPGDQAVDWVGMSLYHWGTQHPWGENEVPAPSKLVDQLRGRYHSAGVDERVVPDFYEVFGAQHGKPVAITETAALYAPGNGGAPEQDIKQAWWRQAFASNLLDVLPWVKMVNWFEWTKYETEIHGTVDWTVTTNPALAAAYAADLPSWTVPAPGRPACA